MTTFLEMHSQTWKSRTTELQQASALLQVERSMFLIPRDYVCLIQVSLASMSPPIILPRSMKSARDRGELGSDQVDIGDEGRRSGWADAVAGVSLICSLMIQVFLGLHL